MSYKGTKKTKKKIRDFTWEDYGISTFRYKELKNFCLQYEEKRSKIKYGVSSIQYDGLPKGNMIGKPTEGRALENLTYENDCRIIEEAAIATNVSIWRYLLRSVTQDFTYEQIEYDEEQGRITICRTDFYGYRRLFFKNLHNLKIGYK